MEPEIGFETTSFRPTTTYSGLKFCKPLYVDQQVTKLKPNAENMQNFSGWFRVVYGGFTVQKILHLSKDFQCLFTCIGRSFWNPLTVLLVNHIGRSVTHNIGNPSFILTSG